MFIPYACQTPTQSQISAYVTQYTCGPGACIDVAGHEPIVGETIACPRNYPLGTKITINNVHYTCSDRTAEWVQKRNGSTFDIFIGKNSRILQHMASQWGKRKLKVQIMSR